MKLAFSTLGCPDWSFQGICLFARLNPNMFEGIEIRGIGASLQTKHIAEFERSFQGLTLARLYDVGLTITNIGTSAMFQKGKDDAPLIEECKHALKICNDMDIKGIRVFGESATNVNPTDDDINPIVDGLLKTCDIAQKLGKAQVWLEIHGNVNTIETLAPILDRVGSHPSFGIIWDIQHTNRSMGNNVAPMYELIKPYVKHMHIKDVINTPTGQRHKLTGEGDIDIPSIVRLLENDNYDGYYSFEWEKRWHPELPESGEAFIQYANYMRGLGR